MNWQLILLGAPGILLLFGLLIKISQRPASKRNWARDQKIMPEIIFKDDGLVTIKHIRNNTYRSVDDFDVDWYDRTFYLQQVISAWLGVEPFGSSGAAHVFVSFGLADGTYIAISVEIRREEGEEFNPLRGMMGFYELIYVIADEKDVIKLRTNFRKNTVRLYPVRATEEQVQTVFVDMLKRANRLARTPELYDTITNNCITNIARHVKKLPGARLPWWDYRYLLGSYVDELAYNRGLIDTDMSLEEARKAFTINERALAAADSSFFSHDIRKVSSII